jgi:hypothetical protein
VKTIRERVLAELTNFFRCSTSTNLEALTDEVLRIASDARWAHVDETSRWHPIIELTGRGPFPGGEKLLYSDYYQVYGLGNVQSAGGWCIASRFSRVWSPSHWALLPEEPKP